MGGSRGGDKFVRRRDNKIGTRTHQMQKTERQLCGKIVEYF